MERSVLVSAMLWLSPPEETAYFRDSELARCDLTNTCSSSGGFPPRLLHLSQENIVSLYLQYESTQKLSHASPVSQGVHKAFCSSTNSVESKRCVDRFHLTIKVYSRGQRASLGVSAAGSSTKNPRSSGTQLHARGKKGEVNELGQPMVLCVVERRSGEGLCLKSCLFELLAIGLTDTEKLE